MSTRRKFLQLLGLAAPAAIVAPALPHAPIDRIIIDDPRAGEVLHGIMVAEMPSHTHEMLAGQHYRFLGIAQLKNEGAPVRYDPMSDQGWEDEA